jgi:hypothetical protein
MKEMKSHEYGPWGFYQKPFNGGNWFMAMVS